MQTLPRKELYDEEGNYLPEITAAAYAEAVEALLEHSDNYRTVTGLELTLRYTDKGWLLSADPQLTAALSGNPSVKGGGEA